jgi:hypothetical protein
LSFLDQLWSAEFLSKCSKLFGSKNWHQSGYFDTLPSLLSLFKVAPRYRKRWAFFFLSKVMPNRVKERALLECQLFRLEFCRCERQTLFTYF